MDPLSDVLSLLKPHNYMSAGFDASGEWSVQFPDQQKSIKTGAVLNGQCWLAVEGVAEPVLLRTGDCFLLPSGRPFRLATDMGLEPIAAGQIFGKAKREGIARWREGGEFFMVSSRFALLGNHGDVLLRMLAPIIHIRDEAGPSLRWSVERMSQELHDLQPGSFLVVQNLAHMMLVEALRLHMAKGLEGGVGWLFALADRQIGAAMSAMHADPAYGWTLQDMAERAGMSRSTFALKFKAAVGSSPMEYLTRWRMLVAGDRLENSADTISTIALSLGYESESAFSTAFKRVMGCSPRQYSRTQAGEAANDAGRMLEIMAS